MSQTSQNEATLRSEEKSRTYQLYSAQTGSLFGTIQALDEGGAVDQFARDRGYANRDAMWKAGAWEYISAHICAEVV